MARSDTNSVAVFNGTNQNLSLSTTHAVTSNAFGADTRQIRVATNVDMYMAIGTTPAATTTDPLLPAGAVEIIDVEPSDKFSGEAVAGTGVCSITEVSK